MDIASWTSRLSTLSSRSQDTSTFVKVALALLAYGTFSRFERIPKARRLVPSRPRLRTQLRLEEGVFSLHLLSSEFPPYVGVNVEREYERLDGFRAQPDWTVVDAGANVGFYTVRQARRLDPASGGRCYAFEPNPTTYSLLQENVRANEVLDRVETTRMALADAPGTAEFQPSGPISTCGRIDGDGSGDANDAFEVEVTTLDRFVRENGVSTIDLLKVDVEGAEPRVLRGGVESALDWTQRIVMEYHGPQRLSEVERVLSSHGFEQIHRYGSIAYFTR